MKHILFFILLLSFTSLHSQQITTFILVRHAEKADASKDPELSEAGVQRAIRFAAMLKETKVDAIYSTNYKRTQNTVAPMAKSKGIDVKYYDPMKPAPIDDMLKNFPGGTIVICGHSNTIPWTANYLSGSESFKNFEDSDYGNLIIVEVVEKGKGKLFG